MSNERAATLLGALGFKCQKEPKWVSGKKPDFFCTGRTELWAEVKTLGPEDRFAKQGDAFLILKDHLAKAGVDAHAIAWVKTPLAANDAKTIANLALRETQRSDFGTDENVEHFVLIPEQPDYKRFVRFSFQAEDGTRAGISAVVSENGKYGWPAVIEPKNYREEVELRYSDRTTKKELLRNIATLSDNIRVAIQLTPSLDGPSLGVAPIGSAATVNTVKRIRDAVSEANAQHKNGCSYRMAPALTMIFHDDLLVAEDIAVAAALYGDLGYSFSPNDFQNGKYTLTENGVFGPGKNTTTSAVCYVRNGSGKVYVHNTWSERRIDVALFPGRHFIPKTDGAFEVAEIQERPKTLGEYVRALLKRLKEILVTIRSRLR